jgi:selenocysteine lyase/cysteine desulfurase
MARKSASSRKPSALAIDLERVRADTPGVNDRLHLNNAGAALMPSPVVSAVTDYIALEARIGGYEAAAQEAGQLDAIYSEVAGLIGAHREEIAITSNATVAWDQAFYALDLKPGHRVLTAQAEHAANYVAFLQRARRDGIKIDVVPNDEEGALDTGALEAMIDDRVALIAVTWIPTNGGLVNPAAEIGRIARRHNIPFLLDACQAVGQMPVDVDALGCDFLCATGRKFLRAPRGTGFLYVRKAWVDALEPAMIDHFAADWVSRDRYELRRDARRFETWERPYALIMGLSAAVGYARELGLDAIRQRSWGLAARLRQALSQVQAIKVQDAGHQRCAIVSFSVSEHEPVDLMTALNSSGINISISTPSSTRLDAESRNLPSLLRASPHYYNTEDEIDRFVAAVALRLRR